MVGLSLKWLQEQVPDGSPAELVDFAVHHATTYTGLAGSRSTYNERPDAKAWYDEAKAMTLKVVARHVPELADECGRRIKALTA